MVLSVRGLLSRLQAVPPAEVSARLAYMRQVAHWLLFDGEGHSEEDASDAFFRELEARTV